MTRNYANKNVGHNLVSLRKYLQNGELKATFANTISFPQFYSKCIAKWLSDVTETTRCTIWHYGFQTTDGAPEQFVLWRFGTVPFCCVIDKCQTHTSDKLEKCVRSVVVFDMSKFGTEQRAFADGINFCFHLKKTAAESYRLLREAHGEHVPSQDNMSGGFGVSKVVTST